MAGKSSLIQITFYFIAITACFCVYSLIQERLMTVGFGPGKEVFKYSVFIVLINRLVTCAVAAVSLQVLGLSLAPSAPPLLFAIPSVANVIGSSAQYEALKYVSFPLQALAKCAKSVPVMAWSWVTGTRRYVVSDYISAVTVTLGCVLFVLQGDIAAPSTDLSTSFSSRKLSFTAAGLALLAIFMIFDGLTCTSQDKLFSSYDMHSCNQLLYTAAWSAALSAGFLVLSGQLASAIGFVLRHPNSLWLMLLQSAVSTTVQLFIVFTIKQYGALNFALMMTLRQFISIVLSCLVFQHRLTASQWFGTALVVGGLVFKTVQKHGYSPSGGLKDKKGIGLLGGTTTTTTATMTTPRSALKSASTGTLNLERQPLLSPNDSAMIDGTPLLATPFRDSSNAGVINKTAATNGGATTASAFSHLMSIGSDMGFDRKGAQGNTNGQSRKMMIPIIASNFVVPQQSTPGNTFVHTIFPNLPSIKAPFKKNTLSSAFPGSGDLAKMKPG